MKPAAVVLDFYDDPKGEGLKKVFPTQDSLPESIKTAHILNHEERTVLRDEAFALILQDEGKIFRKFACVDPGNTLLSVLYFTQNYEKLPEEAVKVAAVNLSSACDEFGLPVPMLLKVASKTGMRRKRDPMTERVQNDDQDWSSRTNLISIQGGSDSGKVSETVAQLKTAAVDVSGADPIKLVKKASVRHALGDDYPLDSFHDVISAITYFGEFWPEMTPADRHEYAVKTAARANELGIDMTPHLERYGSTEYAEDVDAHIASRKASLPKDLAASYTELQTKIASISPDEFAQALTEMDRATGLDASYGGYVMDPYFSTFGGSKKVKEAAWTWLSRIGTYLSVDDLQWLTRNGRPLLHKHFPSDLVNALVKEPITIFDSLPDDAKEIIARMANDRFDGLPVN